MAVTSVHRRSSSQTWVLLSLTMFASALAVSLVVEPVLTVTAVFAITFAAAVIARPVLGAYVLLPTTLLIAGIERGS